MVTELESKIEKKFEAKRSEELIGSIKSLVLILKNEDNKKIVEIDKINQGINLFLDKVSTLITQSESQEKSPTALADSNYDQLISEIKESNRIGQDIIDGQKKIIEVFGKKAKGLKIYRDDFSSTINYIGVEY